MYDVHTPQSEAELCVMTLLTLYQCDKFIIHRAKNTLLYVQCIQSRSNPQYLTLDHEQNLTNSTLYKSLV